MSSVEHLEIRLHRKPARAKTQGPPLPVAAWCRSKLIGHQKNTALFKTGNKDRLGEEAVKGPVCDHPKFERLEAKGEEQLGDKLDQAQDAVRDVLKHDDERSA